MEKHMSPKKHCKFRSISKCCNFWPKLLFLLCVSNQGLFVQTKFFMQLKTKICINVGKANSRDKTESRDLRWFRMKSKAAIIKRSQCWKIFSIPHTNVNCRYLWPFFEFKICLKNNYCLRYGCHIEKRKVSGHNFFLIWVIYKSIHPWLYGSK